MHSIRMKITAVTIAAILTSIFVLGGIGILTIGMESDQSSVEKMRLLTENTQQRLNAYLSSVEQSVEMAVHMADDSLKSLDLFLLGSADKPEEKEELNRVLGAHCAEVEHAFTSIANHTNGIATYYYCVNADLGSDEHGFFWSKVGENEFVKQAPLISTDLDINDTEHTTWYYRPLKEGRAVWVGPYQAHYLGDILTISYVAPIYRYGFLIGVLGMDILFDTMTEQVKATKVYDTGFAILLDAEGKVLYHPQMEPGTTPAFVEQHQDEELGKHLSSGNQLIRYEMNGKERQLSFTTLRNKTKLALTAPVSEINASQRKLTLIILLAAVVILAIFAVVTMVLMNAPDQAAGPPGRGFPEADGRRLHGGAGGIQRAGRGRDADPVLPEDARPHADLHLRPEHPGLHRRPDTREKQRRFRHHRRTDQQRNRERRKERVCHCHV